MIDIISLSISVGAVLVALITHIKFSKCWGFEITTRTPPHSPDIVETQPLLQNQHYQDSRRLQTSEPAILEPTQPIDIPPRPKTKIKNYL
jgi:hypothetical protein